MLTGQSLAPGVPSAEHLRRSRFGKRPGMVLILLATIAVNGSPALGDLVVKPRQVLILHSYHPGFVWTEGIMDGVRSVLGNAADVELVVEYMDTKRRNDDAWLSYLSEGYALKYKGVPFACVLATDDDAFQFALRYGEALFGQTPVVFCGVNHFRDSQLAGHPNFTGVVETADHRATLDLIRKLHPAATRVAIITDMTTNGLGNREILEQLAPEYAPSLEFLFLDEGQGLSQEELFARVETLEPNTPVLYRDFFRDRNGVYCDPLLFAPHLSEHCKQPLYVVGDMYVGHGVLGGKVTSSRNQGQAAAWMVRRILNGEPTSSIPVQRESPNVYMFDYRQMKRFGIPESVLPAHSMIVNKPSSLYQTYREYIRRLVAFILGQSLLIILLLWSVRRRRRSERALAGNLRLVDALLDAIPSPVFEVDPQGVLRRCNRAFADQVIGLRREVIEGRRLETLPPAPDGGGHLLGREPLFDPQVRSGEWQVRCADGQFRPFLLRKADVAQEDERTTGTVAVMVDIAERKRAEEEARAYRDQQQAVLRSVPLPLFAKDRNGRYVLFNSAFEAFFGVTEAQLVGKTVDECWPTDEAVLLHSRDLELVEDQGVRVSEHRVRNAAGEQRHVILTRACFHNAEGQVAGVVGTLMDVTDRIRAEEALRDSQEQYRALYSAITDAVFVHHITEDGQPGMLIEVNDVACHWLGYTREELLQMTIQDIDAPESDVDTQAIVQRLLAGENVLFEQMHRAKDGRRIPVEIHAQVFRFRGTPAILSTARDTTDRKRAEEERRQLEAQIQQTQKLESLGVLAGGIAHDFNNLLMGVLGYADLALQDLPPSSPAQSSLVEIEKAARRAAELCKQMLAYSGRGRFLVEPLDLSTLVRDMSHMVGISVSKKALVRYDFAENLPAIEGDATQLRQIVMNLFINASEALEDRSGVISVRTGATWCDLETLKQSVVDDNLPPGHYVFLEVADTGTGMDEKTAARIFEPFFTTKFTGRGLGLAAVLGIVRGHKGAIQLDSQPGKGTTFRVLFPAVPEPSTSIQEPQGAASPAWHGTGTVLLIDDEETVRTLGRKMLERAGFSVVTAEDGRQGIEVFRRQPDAFVLVLLDLTMPELGGEETCAELRRLRPDVRVIMSSGYTEQEIAERLGDQGIAGFIQKPYQMAGLLEVVRRVLGEGS